MTAAAEGDGNVAKIGETYYSSLAEAITAAQDGDTITLLSDSSGDGIVVAVGRFTEGLTVVFNNHSYTVGVCGYSSNDGVSVTAKGNSTINGDIEISRSGKNANDVKLALESGEVTGKLKIDSSIKSGDATSITKSADVSLTAPTGYFWAESGALAKAVAAIGDTKCATLAEAVAAVENGITQGRTETTFSPDDTCTRAQIVTFLFRLYAEK